MSALDQWVWTMAVLCMGALSIVALIASYVLLGLLYAYLKLFIRLLTDR